MGSLPNLNELGRKGQCPSAYKIGSLIGQPQHGPVMLTYEEKNKILHRHSEYCRNPKIKNNAQPAHILYDDFMLEQMAAYSPISSRSTRNLSHSVRRRDSINSSIGATSVRRLIAVVRNTSGRCGPIYNRRTLIRNLIFFCVSHVFFTSTYLPFLALQGSVSVWILPVENDLFSFNINIGSFLLTTLHIFAALSITFGSSLVQKWGASEIMIIAHVIFIIFYAFHLYPVIYLLTPAYVLLGLILGPFVLAKNTYVMTLSAKLSYTSSEDDEDSKTLRKTCIIRRLSRAFQASHDVGFILGSLLSAVVITYSFNLSALSYNVGRTTEIPQNRFPQDLNQSLIDPDVLVENGTESNCSASSTSFNSTDCVCGTKLVDDLSQLYSYNAFLDAIFDVDELGDRLCGSQACPSKFLLQSNKSEKIFSNVLPETTAKILISVYISICILALICSIAGLDRIRMYVHHDPLERFEGLAAIRAVKESFRDVRLQLAAPLAFFIGLEQAFMYSDFSKSYVVCSLGIHRLNLVFLFMGLLQSIAACTLSMLLRSIRRYYLIAVGFTFHTCLLLVQMLWKPASDDPALFYVISAAWGVCNAIWEMLNFTLLTGLYMDNWEAAFSNSTFFRFLGLAVAFGFHGVLCNWIKVYLLAFFMVVAAIPYTWLEIKLENIRKIKNISRL